MSNYIIETSYAGIYIILFFLIVGLLYIWYPNKRCQKITCENIGKLALHKCVFSMEIIKIYTNNIL